MKAYKEGKIEPYANELELEMPDIEAARNTIAALRKSIAWLKQKE